MPPQVKPIPDRYHTLTPHITVRDAVKMIEFYKKAFGAEVGGVMRTPDGKAVVHAELKIGDSILMLNEESAEWKCYSPLHLNGSAVTLHLYVEDADTVYKRAIAAGGKETMPLMDAFWGDRYGKLQDPSGHNWSIATHMRDMTPAEMDAEAKKAFAEMCP